MAGIALKSQCDFVSVMVPPEVSLKEKNVRQKKDVILKGNKRNAAFSRLFIDCFVTAFRILIKYIGTNFLRMEVFKEFALDLMLEAVDILGRP